MSEFHVQILSGFLYFSCLFPLILFGVSLIIFKTRLTCLACRMFTVFGLGYWEVNNERVKFLECLYNICEALGSISGLRKLWWHRPLVTKLGRRRQADQNLRVILSYKRCFRPHWAIWESITKTKQLQ